MKLDYVKKILYAVGSQNKCLTRTVSAIIVLDDHIIATGYNGTPRGWTNCTEGGCQRCKDRIEGKLKSGEALDECDCIHAEQNAILQAAYHGVAIKDAVMYVSTEPCRTCKKLIANSGIKEVIVVG